jgi:hypothetical protein
MLKVFAIRSLVAAACVCAVAAVGASTAAAAASPPGIVIGPIKVHHGFTLTLFDSSCTSVANTGDLTLEYSKGGSKLSISHDYSGGVAVCKLSKKLGSGSLTASWPGVATIKLKVKNPGKLSKPKAPPGCHGSGGTGRNAVVRGTLKVDIHTGAFGKVNAHKAPAVLDTSGNFSCKPTGNNDISLFGIFGPSPNAFVSGTQPPRGQRSVLISVTGAPLAGGITDEFGLYSQGASKVFNAASTLSSATIGAAAPYMTGSLTFTALPPCSPGAGRNGSFSGALVVHDPVLGVVTIAGSAATDASIALGSATPGFCNGYGSSPAVPSFTDTCSVSGDCSLSDLPGSNVVQFFDSTDAGSQTVTGESWNFGDGSPAVSGSLDQTVTHTYPATVKTYTATLTVTTSAGQVLTATQPVYITA